MYILFKPLKSYNEYRMIAIVYTFHSGGRKGKEEEKEKKKTKMYMKRTAFDETNCFRNSDFARMRCNYVCRKH